ncbi:MAG TPA: hypothetical protein VJ488_03300 [Dehalococcoidia bacterium]|nr:hypothetical protein [Dehalococcoidia bacterium]
MRDAPGQGQHIKVGLNAQTTGTDGLCADIYCHLCDKVYDVIISEQDHPLHTELQVWENWVNPASDFKRIMDITCPACGNKDIVLEPDADQSITCPRCGKGALKGRVERLI